MFAYLLKERKREEEWVKEKVDENVKIPGTTFHAEREVAREKKKWADAASKGQIVFFPSETFR